MSRSKTDACPRSSKHCTPSTFPYLQSSKMRESDGTRLYVFNERVQHPVEWVAARSQIRPVSHAVKEMRARYSIICWCAIFAVLLRRLRMSRDPSSSSGSTNPCTACSRSFAGCEWIGSPLAPNRVLSAGVNAFGFVKSANCAVWWLVLRVAAHYGLSACC